MTPYTMLQEFVLQVAGIAMMLTAIICWINGTMPIANALMCIVMSFLVFGQIKLFGMGMSMLRLASSSIDRTLQTEDMEQMDEKGRALSPQSHDIVFDGVHFSCERREILRGVSAVLPDRSTTAVISPSGSGKTTLCNLIARFWDVDSGTVKIGGHDVRAYTLESLMDQISMVFRMSTSLRTPLRTTSGSAARTQPMNKWWRRRGRPAAMTLSRRSPRATRP